MVGPRDGERRPRILVFAYACEPGRGSEPGAGWGLVIAAARLADCTVLVGPEHVEGIRRWEREHPTPSLRFVGVEEPWPTRVVGRHRITRFVAYLVWLHQASTVGRRLHAEGRFDAVWHATYSVYWLPTPAVRFDVPCLWGPVGGAVATPIRLWPMLGWRGILAEMLDWAAVRCCAALPGTRRTWRRAAVCLAQNHETLSKFPPGMRAHAAVLNHGLFTERLPEAPRRGGTHCVFVGALESRKGAALAIRALVYAPKNVSLEIVGDGPERRRLIALAFRLGLSNRVRFHGRVDRNELSAHLSRAAAAVFTGLREEGGLALAEALLAGVPVIVLANGGALTIAAAATDPSLVRLVDPDTVDNTARALGSAMADFSRSEGEGGEALLDEQAAHEALREALQRTLRSAARVQ